MNDRDRLRLVVGTGADPDATARARFWHPSRGGRPPVPTVGRFARVFPFSCGSSSGRGRRRRRAAAAAASNIVPIHPDTGMLIEMTAWR